MNLIISHGSTRKCSWCNQDFIVRSAGAPKLCSDECKKLKKNYDEKIRKRKIRAASGKKITGNQYACIICNKDFTFEGGRQVLCLNSECKRIYNNRRTNEYSKANPHIQAIRIKNNPQIAMKRRIGSLLRHYLKRRNIEKSRKPWQDILGYSKKDLCEHLEKNFLPGMSWENKHMWHIDHIVPDSHFKYSSYEEDDFRESWKLSNLQPLWADINVRKSNKLNYTIS